jgi:aspartyl/glutamyl-tRNA(Asn/Gln) amidotransferase C subunit
MGISLDEIRHVAKLARLDLDEVEMVALQSNLNALLGHFEELSSVNVTGIIPTSHAVPLENVWAEDVVRPGLTREQVLRNSALHRANLFVVPQILED